MSPLAHERFQAPAADLAIAPKHRNTPDSGAGASRLRASVAAAALATVLLTPSGAQAFSFSGIYAFGDSLSDVGNTFTNTGGLIPPAPYSNGRLSNGDLWLEYLAPRLGLQIGPSVAPQGPRNDFAFAGATTGPANTLLAPPVLLGLQQQLTSYAQASPQADPNALYVIWAGANDYLGGGQLDPTVSVGHLTAAVQGLIGQGARHFLIPNLPDLGQLPGTSTNPASTGLTTLSQGHNALLAQSLALLGQANPQATLLNLDVSGLFGRAIANPTPFGLTNISDRCFELPTATNPLPSICANPGSFLFWDDIHPTTRGHELVADAAYDLLDRNALTPDHNAAVPEPTTVVSLVLAGGWLARLRQKQRAS
jgi:phospholipase/lecithinase/hemolysin